MNQSESSFADDRNGSTATEDAVRRELVRVQVADAVLEQVAIELARQIDQGRAVSAASRELRMVLGVLRGSADVIGVHVDELDELQARREARRQANG